MTSLIKAVFIIGVAIMLTQLKAISDSFGPVVGLVGGILGVIALVITGTKPILGLLQARSYRKNPFDIWYTGTREQSHTKIIGLGETPFTLRIQPKRLTTFKDIHLMLVNRELDSKVRKSRPDDCPDRSVIAVTDLDSKADPNAPFGERVSDYVNGMHASYKQTYERTPEESVYLDVKVKAGVPWHGKLVFIARTADGHTGRVYLDLQVIERIEEKI